MYKVISLPVEPGDDIPTRTLFIGTLEECVEDYRNRREHAAGAALYALAVVNPDGCPIYACS